MRRCDSIVNATLRLSIILKLSWFVKLNSNILKDKDLKSISPLIFFKLSKTRHAQKIMTESELVMKSAHLIFTNVITSFITNYKFYILRGWELSKIFYCFYFRIRSEGIWHWRIIKWLVEYSNGCGLLSISFMKRYISEHTIQNTDRKTTSNCLAYPVSWDDIKTFLLAIRLVIFDFQRLRLCTFSPCQRACVHDSFNKTITLFTWVSTFRTISLRSDAYS